MENQMRVTLINPPQFYSKSQVSAGIVPPLGLAYLASSLINDGHKVDIIDSAVEGAKTITEWKGEFFLRGLEFMDIIKKIPHDTDMIGISNMFTFAYPTVVDLCREIKKEREVPIVLGGAHPSATVPEVLKNREIEFVIISEGEESFGKLCNEVELKKIDGLGYRERNKIRINPKRHFIEDPDRIPFPARHLLPMEKYHEVHEAHGPSSRKWTPIISSRGCPFKCTFCTSALWNYKWRGRSAENVIEEIKECMDKFKIREFHFEDENLTLDRKRVIRICDGIIKQKLDIEWQTPNGIRASVTTNDVLLKMRKSGCRHISVAPESGSERVLNKIMNKKQEIADVRRVVRYASKIDIKTAAYFIIGLPGERREDVRKTMRLANLLARDGLDEVIFGLFVPLPGSRLHESVKGKINEEDTVVVGDIKKAISWSDHITDKELSELRKKAYTEFHITRAIHHPFRSMKSAANVLSGKEETKTERTVRVLLKRVMRGS